MKKITFAFTILIGLISLSACTDSSVSSKIHSPKPERISSDNKRTETDSSDNAKSDSKIKTYSGYTPVEQKLDLSNLAETSDETILDNGADVSVTGEVISVGIISDDTYQLIISVPQSNQLFFASPRKSEVNGTLHNGDKITAYGLLDGHGEVSKGTVKFGISKVFVGKKTTIILDDHFVIN